MKIKMKSQEQKLLLTIRFNIQYQLEKDIVKKT